MAMTKAELLNVFRDAACTEFAVFSPNESDYTYEFSERFERRMDRLIRSESRPAWRFINTNPRRLIIIAIVIVMALFAVACAVPEIRESIAGFFVRMFSDHAEITAPELTKQSIEDEYNLLPIPERYEIAAQYKSLDMYMVDYADENNGLIRFRQFADASYLYLLDSVYGCNTECVINGKKVLFFYSNDFSQAVWEEDGYVFQIYCSPSVEFSVVEKYIDSVTRIN